MVLNETIGGGPTNKVLNETVGGGTPVPVSLRLSKSSKEGPGMALGESWGADLQASLPALGLLKT